MAALWKLPSTRRERQPSLHQLPGEEQGLVQRPRASLREADGGGSHPEIGHQMKEPELRFVGRIGNGRTLEPIAQGLVASSAWQPERARSSFQS